MKRLDAELLPFDLRPNKHRCIRSDTVWHCYRALSAPNCKRRIYIRATFPKSRIWSYFPNYQSITNKTHLQYSRKISTDVFFEGNLFHQSIHCKIACQSVFCHRSCDLTLVKTRCTTGYSDQIMIYHLTRNYFLTTNNRF
jgi:hypothetical protein